MHAVAGSSPASPRSSASSRSLTSPTSLAAPPCHPDAQRWLEVWHGVPHMPPMPNRWHQNVAGDLYIFLRLHWAGPRGCRVHQEVNLTTPQDEPHWMQNFRIPDLVLLDPPRFGIDKIDYMAGPPLVVIEIHSPGDEALAKEAFYAELGVPEFWLFDRELAFAELGRLGADGKYARVAADADGWLRSEATGVQWRLEGPGRLRLRVANDDASTCLITHTPDGG